jgi:hypothetical protein
MKKVILLGIAAIVAGCASGPSVVPIGNGNYEIAGSSVTALSSGGSEKLKLMKQANQYCMASGKQAVLMTANSSDGHVGSYAQATGSAYAPNAGATFNASAVQPGQRATADLVFTCQ